MSFSDIIGHKRHIELLRSAIERKMVSHAYLFSGEDAIGKRLVALAFAKALNCKEEMDPCRGCHSCRLIEGNMHPDVGIIVPDGAQIKIAQIRSLQEKLVYKPYKEGRRVYIIDEAEKMTLEASNSFLKTLEEPPGDTTIILITSRPNSLPVTLLSRCEPVRFAPPPSDLIADLLTKKKGMEYDEARILSLISMGRVGVAYNSEKGEIIGERDRAMDLIPQFMKDGISRIFEVSSNLSNPPGEMEKIILWLMIILRDLLILKESQDPSMIINRDRIGDIESMGRKISPDGIIRLIYQVREAERFAMRNINRQLILESLFISIRDLFLFEEDSCIE